MVGVVVGVVVSWQRATQIANGDIDADHISHRDGHVNGSSLDSSGHFASETGLYFCKLTHLCP